MVVSKIKTGGFFGVIARGKRLGQQREQMFLFVLQFNGVIVLIAHQFFHMVLTKRNNFIKCSFRSGASRTKIAVFNTAVDLIIYRCKLNLLEDIK